MEEFKGFNHDIPDDIETVFDICDKEHLKSVQNFACAKNRKEYLAYIKKEHYPIDFIYRHLMIYYKHYKKNTQKYNTLLKRVNPYYFVKP